MILSNNKLSENNAFLLSIIKNAPYGIIVINNAGIINLINKLALIYLNITSQEDNFINQTIFELTHEAESLKKTITKYIKRKDKNFVLDGVLLYDRYLVVKGSNLNTGMIITIEDVSRIKEMESEVIHAIFKGQEQERRRIAKEIHDGIGPLISTVKLNIENIKSELNASNTDNSEKFENTVQLIDSITSELRTLSHTLMPKVLIDFGVVPALENLCDKITKTKSIQIRFLHSNNTRRFDESIELNLFRIAQELLNNTIKYAQAEKVEIQLVKHPESIVFTYEDDGIGFDYAQVTGESPGIGLINVESRAKSMDASVIFETKPGNGVFVSIEIPLYNG